MGTKGIMALQNLAPNKFQERLSGASRMQENLLAARPGLCYTDPTGERPRPPSWWGGGWLPLPKNPTPAVGSLSFWLRPFGPRPDPK